MPNPVHETSAVTAEWKAPEERACDSGPRCHETQTADRGLLILPAEDEHLIQAETQAAGDRVEVALGQKPIRGITCPESLVRYVIRTHESVILDDASKPDLFSEDDYLLGRVDSHQVQVTVKDCGVGISSENVDRLFDAFFTTKSSGMGMGLSICRSIIATHGGRLWAEPNLPQGATFHFTLLSHQEDAP
jgi:signal transduction histidine kinase